MKARVFLAMFLLVLLVACATGQPNSPGYPSPVDGGVVQPPPAASEAQRELSAQLGVTADQIEIREVQQVQWSNTCLDVPQADEPCARESIAGYRVKLAFGDQQFTFHTNLDGTRVRRVEEVAAPSPAALQARQMLGGMLDLDPEGIRIVSEESVRFADSCLEISIPETACAQVQVRGRRILLEAGGVRFEFHSPDETVAPVLATAAGISAGQTIILLSREGGPLDYCDELNITLSGSVIQYSCDIRGTSPGITFLAPEEQAQLLQWVLAYLPFEDKQTRLDGTQVYLNFYGAGYDPAPFEQQQTIQQFAERFFPTPVLTPTPLPTFNPEEL